MADATPEEVKEFTNEQLISSLAHTDNWSANAVALMKAEAADRNLAIPVRLPSESKEKVDGGRKRRGKSKKAGKKSKKGGRRGKKAYTRRR